VCPARHSLAPADEIDFPVTRGEREFAIEVLSKVCLYLGRPQHHTAGDVPRSNFGGGPDEIRGIDGRGAEFVLRFV